MKLAEKLAQVMAEVGYVQKDATNTGQGYRYASAAAVLGKVNEALSSRGVAVETHAELAHLSQAPGAKGGTNTTAVVKLCLDFTDGEERIHVEGLGSGMDYGDKAVMKANTAALKYAVANAFLISWGDDPEADATTDKEAARALPKSPAEDPFGSGDPATLTSMPQIQTQIDAMKGKGGVKELRALAMHAAVERWSEGKLLAFAKGVGVDLLNGAKAEDFERVLGEMKKARGVGSRL
jgi:hypothetical protein